MPFILHTLTVVNVDHNDLAAHFTTSEWEGFYDMLYIQCNG